MELVPSFAASIIAKFEKFHVREHFGNTLKRSFKGHKNSEWQCYRHNWLISIKKMMRTGKAVLSQSCGLIPFKTVQEKRGGLLWAISRKRNWISLRSAAFVTIFTVI